MLSKAVGGGLKQGMTDFDTFMEDMFLTRNLREELKGVVNQSVSTSMVFVFAICCFAFIAFRYLFQQLRQGCAQLKVVSITPLFICNVTKTRQSESMTRFMAGTMETIRVILVVQQHVSIQMRQKQLGTYAKIILHVQFHPEVVFGILIHPAIV